jgi:hypothetical protein
MLNIDCNGSCVCLVSRWHYYVGIDVNSDKNIIKWIIINVKKLWLTLMCFIIGSNYVWAQLKFM